MDSTLGKNNFIFLKYDTNQCLTFLQKKEKCITAVKAKNAFNDPIGASS